MRDRLPAWLASADPGAGIDDPELLAAAEAESTGLIEVDDDGSVRWSDEAYRLHGRPRWRRVRTLDDVTRGLNHSDAGRVTAAYLSLVGTGDLALLYTVTGETGQQLDVVLQGVRPGLAIVQRAAYSGSSSTAAADDRHVEPPANDEPATIDPPMAEEPAVQEPVIEELVIEEPAAEQPDPAPAVVETDESGAALVPGLPDPESDQAFRALFDASPSALVELRDDGSFVRVNDAFGRLVGRTWDSLRDTVYEALIHHEDRASAFVSRTRREGDGAGAPAEYRLLHSDGSVVWVRTRTSPIESAAGPRLLVSLDNVTAARAREEQLRHDALHDALTGLPNRRLVLDRLERAVSRARRAGQRLAVFFIDVDDLKHVNDTHPWQHKAGDVLLTNVAVSMRGALRETDTLGRLAGDEFLVICEEVGDDVAVADLAQRLLDAAREQIQLGPQTISPTVSIGLALSTGEEETAEELLGRADAAMYVAKSHGGGRVERAEEPGGSAQPDLVGALARGELRMQYQPVVSLETGSVLGMTAVLRWMHPSLGLLPAHQVRTALDSAAVLPVVDWAIDRAINDVRTVAPSRVDHVSVWLPVPGRALQAASTRDAVRSAVLGPDGGGTPDTAPSLVLDVHESDLATLARRPSLRRQLAALTETGPVAVGVEHLSADAIPVGSLQLLGAASASLDPELVLSASENEAGEALVRSLVVGAASLGVVTIATGVSSPELLDEARRLGVHAVAGDLVGPAASLEDYSDLLHGERVQLPGSAGVAVVRPFDDADYADHGRRELGDVVDDDEPTSWPEPTPIRPPLSAVRALEEESGQDLLAEALADDEPVVAEPVVAEPVVADPVVAEPVLDVTAPAAPAEEPVVDVTAPAAPAEEPSEEPAVEPAAAEAEPVAQAPEAEVPAEQPRPSRLLLGDVVDLAEQVARDLGVTLPGDAARSGASQADVAEQVARELGVALPPIAPTDRAAVPAVPAAPMEPARTQPRLPGLADLYAALGSPEVSRAFPERVEQQEPAPIADAAKASTEGTDPTPIESAARAAAAGLEAPVADLREQPVIDLRTGQDEPHLLLRTSPIEHGPTSSGPWLQLRGLGGSDGGSIL